jgi:hypothetical protein
MRGAEIPELEPENIRRKWKDSDRMPLTAYLIQSVDLGYLSRDRIKRQMWEHDFNI